MRRILALAALVSVGSTGCRVSTMIESRDHVREGNAAYADARYEDAIHEYDASLEVEPDGVTVLWNRACAAESIVLRLKEETEDEAKLADRKKFAQMALDDFAEWYSRLEQKTEADQKALDEHVLAVLSADARCDDLIDHWTEQHRADPKDEGLYAVIARTWEETCGQPDKADEWFVKRTKDFPESAKAQYALAVRRFEPLFPDPESGLPYNQSLDTATRMKFADEAIALLNRATELEPNYRDPYVWRSMAYNQKMFARVFADPAETTEDKLEAIAAREDSMLAWRETKAVCDIDSIPDCARDVEPEDLAPERVADLAGKEISVRAKVDPATIVEVDAAKHVFELSVEVKPKDPAAAGGARPAGQAPAILKVRYTFMTPEVAAGEEAVDLGAHVAEVKEAWGKGSEFFIGKLDAAGKLLEVEEKPPAGCCPAAPLTDREVAADTTMRNELTVALAAEQAAAERRRLRGGRGR